MSRPDVEHLLISRPPHTPTHCVWVSFVERWLPSFLPCPRISMLRMRVWMRVWITSFRAAISIFLSSLRHCRILSIAIQPRVLSSDTQNAFDDSNPRCTKTYVRMTKSVAQPLKIHTIIYHMTIYTTRSRTYLNWRSHGDCGVFSYFCAPVVRLVESIMVPCVILICVIIWFVKTGSKSMFYRRALRVS